MLRFKRPRAPAGYAARARAAERALRADIRARRKLEFDVTFWRSYKADFITAQHGKCGYCEQPSLNHPGAVEHYAPKSEIHELLDPGAEHAVTSSVEGRRTPSISDAGYWWLAYTWDNWLFTCERCNSGWKRCLFPVRERRRALPPRRTLRETPLLLHPFGRIDPILHLRFPGDPESPPLGQIAARNGSDRGSATIATCGLDRESLRRVRAPLAGDTHRYVARLEKALADDTDDRALEAVIDLLLLGADHRAHAGMVRAIVGERLGQPWSELVRLKKRLQARLRRRGS